MLGLAGLALILSACSSPNTPAPQAASEEPSAATVEATTEPEPETFGDMLARVGVVPDDEAGYEAYAVEQLFESEMTDVGPGFRFQVQDVGQDDPASGRSPEVVRYVVEHNCPERLDGAEQYLAEMG